MMAAWIKMNTDLPDNPHVVRMSSALKAPRLHVVGALYRLWCIADAHTEDGRLDGYTPDVLDELVGISGFSAALESVGWLIVEAEAVIVPDFTEHNGQSAKRRAKEAKRKQESRRASASDADRKRPREEKDKSRVDKEREDSKGGADALPPKQARKKFTPPSVEEVAAYCAERRNSVDPCRFVDYYAAQGWKLSNGRSMADWKAAVRATWEKNSLNRAPPTNGDPRGNLGLIQGMIEKGDFDESA